MRSLLLIVIFLVFFMIYYYGTVNETFEVSSSFDVGSGASSEWGWGFGGIDDPRKNDTTHKKTKCPKCDYEYVNDNINIVIDDKHDSCKNCDITKNKDIDKYVLKSSIPPCPDMSNYATKAMVHAGPDMNKYILKSKIGEYCDAYFQPTVQAQQQQRCVPDDDITQHPQYNMYISKDKCRQYKKSFIQNLEDWLFKSSAQPQQQVQQQQQQAQEQDPYSQQDPIIDPTHHENQGPNGFPAGYGYSPYAGYGTDNVGYALDGGDVVSRSQ